MSNFIRQESLQEDEFMKDQETVNKNDEYDRTEIYILSQTGKPIYCSTGTDDEFVTLSPVIQTIIFHFKAINEEINFIQTNKNIIGFLSTKFVILMIVSPLMIKQHVRGLLQMLFQLMKSISMPSIESAYSQCPSEIVCGVEHLLDSYINNIEQLSFMTLQSVEYYPINRKSRKIINKILQNNGFEEIVFQLILANFSILGFYVTPQVNLSLSDLYIVLNLVSSKQFNSDSIRWVPVRLPCLNEEQFFHCYISYMQNVQLQDGSRPMLVTVSTDCNVHGLCMSNEERIIQALKNVKSNDVWKEAVYFELLFRSKFERVCHYMCIYNQNGNLQSITSNYSSFYSTIKEKIRIKMHYERIYTTLNNEKAKCDKYFYSGKYETICGSRNPNFTLLICIDLILNNDMALVTLKNVEDFFKMELSDILPNKPLNQKI